MNERLKKATQSVEPPPYLEAKIRANLHAVQNAAPRSIWARPWTLATTAAAICLAAGLAWSVGYLRLTAESEEAYLVRTTMQVGTLMRVGLGDHIHCSVLRKYPKVAPKLEELEKTMGPEYAGLVPLVRSQVPGNFRLMMAHKCRYNDRRFVHLTLQSDSSLVSVIVVRKEMGESFQTEQLVPALAQAGIPIYQSGAKDFHLASFESRDHMVYVISDQPGARNMEMMVALAAPVQAYLKAREL